MIMKMRERALLERELYLLKERNFRKKNFMAFLMKAFRVSNIVHFCNKSMEASTNGLYDYPIYELTEFAKEEGFSVRCVRVDSLDVLL